MPFLRISVNQRVTTSNNVEFVCRLSQRTVLLTTAKSKQLYVLHAAASIKCELITARIINWTEKGFGEMLQSR